MANKCELLINTVSRNKRNVLIRFNQKGKWSSYSSYIWEYTTDAPPVNRQRLRYLRMNIGTR